MAAYAIQFRRGTTTEHNSFTGLLGEVTVDTDKKTVVVHDGSTAGGSALALEGAATNTTTGTYSSNVTVGGTLGVTGLTTMSGGGAVTGNLTMTGHILPSANITYDLGSSSMMWKDIYVGPGSLYVNGKKVIEDDSGSINITTDNNEDLKLTTTGTGTLKFISGNGINFTGELGAVSGDLQIGDHVDMNSSLIKELATPVSGTDAANKTYVDTAAASAVTGGANAGSFTTVTTSGNATIGGDLTVNGTTTSVNTSQIDLADNILLLNSDATGSATQNAGVEVERGDDTNVQLLWNETDNRWDIGGEDFITTGDIIGDLTGDVTGTVSSIANHTTADLAEGADLYFTTARARSAISVSGDISYNSTTGVISTTGLASSDTDDLAEGSGNLYYTTARWDTKMAAADSDDLSEGSTNLYYTDARAEARADARITNALKDEDDMASDSATHVASQQSIKAYVTSQIATKDNTDEMTEGSTNLYYTDARARAAISEASNQLAYNNGTGVLTYTQGDSDTVSEGSTNLYYTDARADARITAADTGDLSEGTNLYYTTARWDTKMAAADTDDLSEGSTNKYFSNTLARGAISVSGDISYDSGTGVISTTGLASSDTDDLAEGSTNLYYTNARADARIANALKDEDNMASDSATHVASQQSIKAYVDSQVATIDNTDEMTEGSTNLYFTNARADARIAAADTGDLTEGSNLYYTDARVDSYINASILTTDVSEGTNLYYTTARWDTKMAAADTGDLSEGSNLYYTTARWDTKMAAADTGDLSEGTNLYYTTARDSAQFDTDLATKDTGDLSEGTNLYYTNARADARIAAADTDDLSEGSSNLYYTNARADARIAAADTDDLSEGSTNKYYTDARARSAISASGDLSYNSTTGVMSYTATQSDINALNITATGLSGSPDVSVGNITATGYLRGPSTFTIDPAVHGANSGTVVIAGDLQVDGTTTTINSTTVAIDDLNFSIATDAADSSAANGAGITIGGANATLNYTHATTSWDMNKSLNVTGNIGVSGTVDGRDMQTDGDKLDLIEASATADQTDAEIRAAVEAATDSNVFTDADHTKLDGVDTSANNYSLPLASSTVRGGVKIGYTESGKNYPVELSSEKMYVNVPWTDNNTTYTSSDFDHDALTNFVAEEHVDWAGASAGTIHSSNYTNTTYSVGDGGLSQKNFTTTLKNKLDGIEAGADHVDTANVSAAGALMTTGGTMSGDIAMGGNDITGAGTFYGIATTAQYADLAERYAADAPYEEGTLVMFGGEAEVTSAQGYGSTKIAGVVSTTPGFAMNEEAGNSETHPYIALQGRVPCKVTGTVSKGDILVASEISGIATKWLDDSVDPRMTAYVGIAIEDKTTDGEGYVEVKVGK